MTGMIEKVARAILHRQLAGFSDQYAEETWYAVAREERENSAAWRLAVVQARAAIEAMREPAEGMVEEAASSYALSQGPGYICRFDAMRPALTAALTAALTEGEG